MAHLKALLTLACFVLASPALAQRYMDFGGMYGYAADCTNGVCGNPYANNTDACPSGYTAYQVYGRPGAGVPGDQPVYLCGRITTGNTTPVADFGGMWSFTYANPFTGSYSCPTGYTQTQVLGTYNMDYGLYYCHRTAAANPQFRLGGMYTYYFNGSASVYYPNPVLTNLKDACPTNFTAHQSMGVVDWVDDRLFFCHNKLY